ncbi:MAG TPA: hypothetical protein VMV13_06365, partial [Candidatus Binataceae bacterium]|nr:hypothetical protein [Candidatus Binataceae bacterium]
MRYFACRGEKNKAELFSLVKIRKMVYRLRKKCPDWQENFIASAADGLQQNNCARPDRSNRLRASGWATRSEECGAASSGRAKHQGEKQAS